MKTLILMRHSHAVSNNPAYSDFDRPLTNEGRSLAKQTANLMKEWNLDRIVCSSAARTIEPAEEIAASQAAADKLTDSTQLYLASPNDYVSAACDLATPNSKVVLIVGHNPGIASLICKWADDYLPIPPATFAVFQLAITDWQQLVTQEHLTKELVGFVSNGVRIR